MASILKTVVKSSFIALCTTALFGAASAVGAVEQVAQSTGGGDKKITIKGPIDGRSDMRIAAVVNNEIITVRDLRARLDFIVTTSRLPRNKETTRRIASQVLRALIEERLKIQEAKRLGIKVTKKDVNAAVGRIEKRNNIPTGQLIPVLAKQGVDARTLVEQIESAIAWNKVVLRRIRPRVRIAEEEVRELIERYRSSQGVTRYRVSEIFLAVDSAAQDKDVRQTAQRLFDQMRRGANFPGIARQFSQSPSASVGGDLGWVESDVLPREVGRQVIKMQIGQIAGPIRTVEGYYIVALRDRQVAGGGDPSKVTVSVAQLTLPVPAQADDKAREAALETVRKVSGAATSCDALEKASKDAGASGGTRLKNVRVSALAPALQRPALTLDINKASEPIRTTDGYVVFMVCERAGGAKIPTASQIRNQLGRRKINLMSRRYLRDLRRSAFLDVRV